jgi:cytochrome c oxidase subunit II
MGLLGKIAILQGGASSFADQQDLLFWAITGNAVFFTGLIFLGIIYFSAKYRRGAKADRSRPPQYNLPVELAWTIIPLGIAMGIFVWASTLYMHLVRPPKGSMEIHVVGKQWMWKLQHPNGRWEMNSLHVPAGRPVVLTMTSEDVVHAFFIPAFRIKRDVIPGQFTSMWFTPTKPGSYRLFCAEFCGTLHSSMDGWVTVMDPAEYERWLNEGSVQETAIAEGARLFRWAGCSGCHSPNSSVRAPLLEGLYGQSRPVQVTRVGTPLEQTPATTITADTRYIHDSIVMPRQEVAAGYRPIMPVFKNRLTEEQIFQIIAYIRSLSEQRKADDSSQGRSPGLSEEDYRARVGFTPENIGELTQGGGGTIGARQPNRAGTTGNDLRGLTGGSYPTERTQTGRGERDAGAGSQNERGMTR